MVDMMPSEVQRISQDLKTVSDTAKAEVGKLFATSNTAAQGNQGWQSAQVLSTCVTTWQTELSKVIEEVQDKAIFMGTSASAVHQFDQEGERRLRAVLNELANT